MFVETIPNAGEMKKWRICFTQRHKAKPQSHKEKSETLLCLCGFALCLCVKNSSLVNFNLNQNIRKTSLLRKEFEHHYASQPV
jgi:hypothetical protein